MTCLLSGLKTRGQDPKPQNSERGIPERKEPTKVIFKFCVKALPGLKLTVKTEKWRRQKQVSVNLKINQWELSNWEQKR